MTVAAPKDSSQVRSFATLIVLIIVLAACSPDPEAVTTTTTAAATTTTSVLEPSVRLAGSDGRLVVQGRDGSVVLVEPGDGATEVIHEGDGGPVAQATGSADGGAVVWTQTDPDGEVGLWVGGEASAVDAPFAPFFYAFAPDGLRVAMLGNQGDEVALAVLELATGVVDLVDQGVPYYLDWHLDSSAFGAHIGSDFTGQVGLDGGRSPVAGVPGLYRAPEWVGRRHLVAVLERDDVIAGAGIVPVQLDVASQGAIAVVTTATGRSERIVDVSGAVAFDVSPDGERLAFVEADAGSEAAIGSLSVIGLDGTGRTVVSPAPVVAFEWSPDGTRLLFTIVDPGSGVVAAHVWDGATTTGYDGYFPTEVTVLQYLPFWDQYTRSLTTWSPSGDAFVYAAQGTDGGEIWVQPLEGERRRVSEGEFASWVGDPGGGAAPVLP